MLLFKTAILKLYFYFFLLVAIGCKTKDSVGDFFKSIAQNDIALAAPNKGEWRYEHKEKYQPFIAYKNNAPVHLTKDSNTIFIRPFGKFSAIQNKILSYAVDYLTIFFQTTTVLLPASSDSIIPDSARRMRDGRNEQLLASYFLNPVLKQNFPKQAVAYMAITAKDLYPSPTWNFVFGLASYEDRIGVSSIYRLCTKNMDSSNYQLCLRRLIQVASHEIGHMFSLHHCVLAKCTMNGSNTLSETDGQPNRLCSDCLQKLSWDLKFDNKKRLAELRGYFLKHKLQADYELASADVDAAH